MLLLIGCHQEPPPPLYTGVSPDAVSDAPEAAPERSGRGLWFADGPGLEAQLARERRDHPAAVASLDALLADPNLHPDDRGVGLLLRGLEDLEARQWAQAANALAQARAAPGLTAIDAWLRATEAQARLDTGEPAVALSLVKDLSPTPPLAQALLLIDADASARTGAGERARERYEEYLRVHSGGGRRHEVRLKLAELRIAGGEVQAAAQLLERVALDVPLSEFGQDALARIDALVRDGSLSIDAAHRLDFERERALAEIRDRLEKRDHARVVRDVDAFVARKGLSAADRCAATYLQASAVFKQRDRARAMPYYEKAAKLCKAADSIDEVVKSRYQAARGRFAQGRHAAAAREFEKLADDHPEHSYFDDALVKAGESWEEAGESEKARHAYERALASPQRGDMADEARRRLLVQAFVQKRHDDVLGLVDAALQSSVGQPRQRAKLHYLRGRALAEQGDREQAKAAWLASVSEMPLSYPAVLSLSRLREHSPAALQEGLAVLGRESEGEVGFGLPAQPGVERARLFARLGLGAEAEAELDAADVGGWPAVALLSQAGLYDEVQIRLADMSLEWRKGPPVGAHERLWAIAHPIPFSEIITPGERELGVPELLTFAVMQTESRFDPGVTSWAGARGLVQLMPGTAKLVAERAGVEFDGDDALYDPATNLGLGMRYLAQLTRRWGGGEAGSALAIPSYNAGAGAVDQWVQERGDWPLDLFIEGIPYDETRNYTEKVLERWAIYRWMYGEGTAGERLVYLPTQVPKRAG